MLLNTVCAASLRVNSTKTTTIIMAGRSLEIVNSTRNIFIIATPRGVRTTVFTQLLSCFLYQGTACNTICMTNDKIESSSRTHRMTLTSSQMLSNHQVLCVRTHSKAF